MDGDARVQCAGSARKLRALDVEDDNYGADYPVISHINTRWLPAAWRLIVPLRKSSGWLCDMIRVIAPSPSMMVNSRNRDTNLQKYLKSLLEPAHHDRVESFL